MNFIWYIIIGIDSGFLAGNGILLLGSFLDFLPERS